MSGKIWGKDNFFEILEDFEFWEGFGFQKEACSMGGISKRRSHIEVETHLSSRFKLFFLGGFIPATKKNMSEQCLVFPIFQPTFWFTQDLYTVCLGLSFHRFTVSPSPSIDSGEPSSGKNGLRQVLASILQRRFQ